MSEPHFVSVYAPTMHEIRTRTILAQYDEGFEDVNPESIYLDFTFQSENGRVHFELHTLPVRIKGDTLTVLVLDVFVHGADSMKESFQPEEDLFVRIRLEADESGKVTASFPASALPFLNP